MKQIFTLILLLFFYHNYAQSPGGVNADNTVWLKANQGVTTIGSSVTNWTEYSGGSTGNFSTHSPGAGGATQLQPTLLEAGINFNPYIVFNQTAPNCISSNNLINGNTIFGTNEVTMFQVINLHTGTGTGVWCKWQTSNTAPGRLGNEVNNGGVNTGKIRFDYRGGSLYSTNNILNSHVMFTGMTNGSTLLLRLFGVQDNQMTVYGTNNQPGTGRLALGNDNEVGVDPYPTTVDIAELIMYSRSLNATELNKVESYLAVKYGMTLVQTGASPNDYIASNGTVIWDNSDNGPYLYNITGIGRDDNSALMQKQSQSINEEGFLQVYYGNYPTGAFPNTNNANTNSFGTDLSYLLFGNNDADTIINQCVLDGILARMERVWKVQETGFVSTVTIAFDNTLFPAASSLLVSSDPTFTSDVTVVPLQQSGGRKYGSYDFSDNQYFTLATAPLVVTESIDPILCAGMTASIHLTTTGGAPPYTYTWNTIPPQTTSSVTGLSPGTYEVTIEHGGCSYTTSYVITGSTQSLEVSTSKTDALCTSASGSIVINTTGGTQPYKYELNNDGAFQYENAFYNLTAGTYNIKVVDRNGCIEEQTVIVNSIKDTFDLEFEIRHLFCDIPNDNATIYVSAMGGKATSPYSYTVSGVGNFNHLPILIPNAGHYTITATDRNGCKGVDTFSIVELACCQVIFPSAFSPNGDGLNDIFKPYTNEAVQQYNLQVFNRWGQMVFQSFNPAVGWNGIINEIPANKEVYFYILNYQCPGDNEFKILKGDVTLIR